MPGEPDTELNRGALGAAAVEEGGAQGEVPGHCGYDLEATTHKQQGGAARHFHIRDHT